jgi:hypothetical protein
MVSRNTADFEENAYLKKLKSFIGYYDKCYILYNSISYHTLGLDSYNVLENKPSPFLLFL